MDLKKLFTIGLALGVVGNVADFVVQGNLLAGYYAQPPFTQENNIPWFIAGDFVAALVFTWVYLVLGHALSPGVAGGARFGFYAGVLVTFPANIFTYLTFDGIPYALAWIWTIFGIVWYVILGSIAGAMNTSADRGPIRSAAPR